MGYVFRNIFDFLLSVLGFKPIAEASRPSRGWRAGKGLSRSHLILPSLFSDCLKLQIKAERPSESQARGCDSPESGQGSRNEAALNAAGGSRSEAILFLFEKPSRSGLDWPGQRQEQRPSQRNFPAPAGAFRCQSLHSAQIPTQFKRNCIAS